MGLKLPGRKIYRFAFSGLTPEWCAMPDCCINEVFEETKDIKRRVKGYLNNTALIERIESLPDGEVTVEQEWISEPVHPVLTLSDLTTAHDLVSRQISDFQNSLPRQLSKGVSELVLTEADKLRIETLESRKKRIVDAIEGILETL